MLQQLKIKKIHFLLKVFMKIVCVFEIKSKRNKDYKKKQ